MSILEKLDWSLILQPLAGAQPCGADLQNDPEYDAIRRAREPDTDSLPAGVWERPDRKIDWAEIGTRCFDILAHRSKDLQVGAWMVEAFVYEQDLEGAARGVNLFCELATTFWPDIYPQLEEADADLRLRPLNWMLRESPKWFSTLLPITSAGPSATGLDYSCRHVHWQTLVRQFKLLDEFLFEKLGAQSPSFAEVHALLRAQLQDSVPLAHGMETLAGLVDFAGNSEFRSREAAYDQLRAIGTYLARVEPHSPVPMVLEALSGWRNASFEDLLQRLPAQGGASVYELMRLFKQGS